MVTTAVPRYVSSIPRYSDDLKSIRSTANARIGDRRGYQGEPLCLEESSLQLQYSSLGTQVLRTIEKNRDVTFNLQDHLLGGVRMPLNDNSSLALTATPGLN